MLQIYLSLALVLPIFTSAFPRAISGIPESPICFSSEEIPDYVNNASNATDEVRYTYKLHILPAADFYYAEAKDILYHVLGIINDHKSEEDVTVGGYKYDVDAWPGEKPKMFKMDRFTPLSDFKWKDATVMVQEMLAFLNHFPSPPPFRIGGLEVLARNGVVNVAWSRLTYARDRYPWACEGESSNVQPETS